jgi:HPt (histidine-containing phosphotransfer) domain-containing protein
MNQYLSKPIQVAELARALAKVEPQDGGALASGAAPPEPRPAAAAGSDGKLARPESTLIDRRQIEILDENLGHDVDLVTKLLGNFLDEAPQLLAAVRSAVDGGDAAALELAAHSLKSASATFGAMKVAELCKVLEDCGKGQSLDGAAELAAEVEAVLPAALQALRDGYL